MKLRTTLLTALCAAASLQAFAQHNGLVDMSSSPEAIMANTPLGAVKWTGGFWGERFDVLTHSSLPGMWATWNNPDVSHGFRNFEVAAGLVKGEHKGPPFHDGDFYKWLEGVATVYAVNHDPELSQLMDRVISVIARAQRQDGYIHTPVIIDELNKGIDSHVDTTVIGITVGDRSQKGAFASRLNFETYNLGHLMTAGCVHYRATGKTTLFNVAKRAADFLYHFYKTASAELARNAICPSHYMGVTEMWRTTHDPKYLELSRELVNLRDSVKNGEDHNQDRIPFRKQYEAVGHAVRANYLYAGVADLYAETGEKQLMKNLTSIWDDIANRKIYITGGCGALYDGVSPDGTTYDQPYIQQIHQAYGRAFQLPNETSHNETCADIGELLYSWRMFETTGTAKYADMVEHEFYNGILSGISLDGKRYFYTNALRKSKDFPYVMRWPKERQEYISCFCCPPNTFRTLCEAQEYAYSVGKGTLWCNVYGQNTLKTDAFDVEQTTTYPFDGTIELKFRKAKDLEEVKLRIPAWCTEGAEVMVNGQKADVPVQAGSYVSLKRKWRKGDVVKLLLPMKVKLIEANPLVEENKNQIAVMRGPLVYCLEQTDISDTCSLNDVVIPADIQLTPVPFTIDGHRTVALEGEARVAQGKPWTGTLYRELGSEVRKARIRLIPYYAWGNRGNQDMSVWLPLAK
jgi:DUF1680 family protein